MSMKKFRSKYERIVLRKSFKGFKSLADKQYKDECSVEGIIRRYGVLPKPESKPLGVDVSEYGDFHVCMDKVQTGIDEFMSMPSNLRARFGNDPRAFYDWIHNPSNVSEAVKLGLMIPQTEEKTAVDVLEEIKERLSAKEGDTAKV